ncbi:MAG: PD-(D/E)XK nuclease family protein [Lentisphaeria bacterium]|nr:PD-(D/E)XK nuclease family protein [Lentisphaeria bacterium]
MAWLDTFDAFMRDLDRRRVPYLSHSKVATVERCPKCYYDQYVLGVRPASSALTTGLLFHEAAALFYAARQSHRGDGVPGGAALPAEKPAHPEPGQQDVLDNAVATMVRNAWDGYEVVAVEKLFFMDLSPGLPPAIGIIDLVLRRGNVYVVVDHKTTRRFGEPDAGQLMLYAEHLRRALAAAECTAFFDEYRLVPDLARVRKPVFRRSQVPIPPASTPALVNRYRRAWEVMTRIQRGDRPNPASDCWFCNRSVPRWS